MTLRERVHCAGCAKMIVRQAPALPYSYCRVCRGEKAYATAFIRALDARSNALRSVLLCVNHAEYLDANAIMTRERNRK